MDGYVWMLLGLGTDSLALNANARQIGFDEDDFTATTGGRRKQFYRKLVRENGAFWLAHIPLVA